MKKIYHGYMIFATIFIILASIYLTWIYCLEDWLNPFFSSYGQEMITDKAIYHKGDNIVGSWERCLDRKLNSPIKVRWSFVDSIIYNLPEQINTPKTILGCQKIDVVITKIPNNLPTGKYYLIGEMEIKVNKVKDKIIERRTNWFEVID